MATALGITVPTELLDRWRGWFAPELQPFPTARIPTGAGALGRAYDPELELRDTFHVYRGDWTWLDEAEFTGLDLRTRRALLHGRAGTGRLRDVPVRAREPAATQRTDTRVVWWPPLLRRAGDGPLLRYVENGLPPSRHREVRSSTWTRAAQVLPRAADLAGRLATSSGPNCFGNVLAATGIDDAHAWLQREPFDRWLAATTRPIRGTQHDHHPGVVLVWRNHDGGAEHAAVTLGDGYVHSKPSQGWYSPRVVWTIAETIAASRYRGAVLHRYLITS